VTHLPTLTLRRHPKRKHASSTRLSPEETIAALRLAVQPYIEQPETHPWTFGGIVKLVQQTLPLLGRELTCVGGQRIPLDLASVAGKVIAQLHTSQPQMFVHVVVAAWLGEVNRVLYGHGQLITQLVSTRPHVSDGPQTDYPTYR
jgi:hypothetical protein